MINKKNIKRSIKESKLVEIQLPKLNYFAQNNHVNNDSESDEEYVNKDFQCISFNEEHSKKSSEKICISCLKQKSSTLFNRYFNYDTIKEINNYHSNITNKQNERIMFNYLIKTSFNNQANSDTQKNSFLLMENNSEYLNNNNIDQINQNKLNFDQINNQEKNTKREQLGFKVEELCNQCWIYWKKYGEFKYTYYYQATLKKDLLERPCPEKRQDRLNAIRSQLNYKCCIDNCNKEFKMKEEFINHSLICHCLIVKKALLNAKSKYQNLHNFYLKTTSFNKAIRSIFSKNRPKYFKGLARHPFKEIVDINSILNECKIIISLSY